MKIMHDCPHCSSTIGINAWQLARADTYFCDHCELPVQPTFQLRKVALRLIVARRCAEQEFAASSLKPEDRGPIPKESDLGRREPLPAE